MFFIKAETVDYFYHQFIYRLFSELIKLQPDVIKLFCSDQFSIPFNQIMFQTLCYNDILSKASARERNSNQNHKSDWKSSENTRTRNSDFSGRNINCQLRGNKKLESTLPSAASSSQNMLSDYGYMIPVPRKHSYKKMLLLTEICIVTYSHLINQTCLLSFPLLRLSLTTAGCEQHFLRPWFPR